RPLGQVVEIAVDLHPEPFRPGEIGLVLPRGGAVVLAAWKLYATHGAAPLVPALFWPLLHHARAVPNHASASNSMPSAAWKPWPSAWYTPSVAAARHRARASQTGIDNSSEHFSVKSCRVAMTCCISF